MIVIAFLPRLSTTIRLIGYSLSFLVMCMIGWDTDIDLGRWRRRTKDMGLGTGYHIDLIFLHIDRFHSGH